MSDHYVEIVQLVIDREDGAEEGGEPAEIVKRMGPHDKRTAEKIADGVEINLNWNRFFVRVVTS